MLHIVQRWVIRVFGRDGKMRTEFHMDDDNYSRVLETSSRLYFGMDVGRIEVSRQAEQGSSGLTSSAVSSYQTPTTLGVEIR